MAGKQGKDKGRFACVVRCQGKSVQCTSHNTFQEGNSTFVTGDEANKKA